MDDAYHRDFYAWAMRQAGLLRARSGNALDWDHVAEEIESLGKSQESELRSRYAVLLAHLLKWRFQPERRGASWENTIRTQRALIADHLGDNPGLKPKREALFQKAYVQARGDAATEMDRALNELPEATPFSLDAAMDPDFWPDPEVTAPR